MKKIIALGVSLVLIVIAVVSWGGISTVSAGKGNGTSKSIKEVDDIVEVFNLIAKTKDFGIDDYDTNIFGNKSFTFINTSFSYASVYSEIIGSNSTSEVFVNRNLELYVNGNMIYYKIKGNMIMKSQSINTEYNYYSSSTSDFDIALYFENDSFMFKITTLKVATAEKTNYDSDEKKDKSEAKIIDFSKIANKWYKFDSDKVLEEDSDEIILIFDELKEMALETNFESLDLIKESIAKNKETGFNVSNNVWTMKNEPTRKFFDSYIYETSGISLSSFGIKDDDLRTTFVMDLNNPVDTKLLLTDRIKFEKGESSKIKGESSKIEITSADNNEIHITNVGNTVVKMGTNITYGDYKDLIEFGEELK